LLLYKTLGLAFGVLCFDKTVEKASTVKNAQKTTIFAIPAPSLSYSTSLENEDDTNSFIKKEGEFHDVVQQKSRMTACM